MPATRPGVLSNPRLDFQPSRPLHYLEGALDRNAPPRPVHSYEPPVGPAHQRDRAAYADQMKNKERNYRDIIQTNHDSKKNTVRIIK